MAAQTVLVVGDCGTGKTVLCRALRNGLAKNDTNNAPTIGVQASVAECFGPGVILWDCSGNASTDSLRIAHVRKASALIAVFDVSRPSTFESALTLIHNSKQARPLDKLGQTKFPVALVALCHLKGSTAGVNMISEEQQKERGDRLAVNIIARISLASHQGLPLFTRRLRAALSAQKHAGTTAIPMTMTTTSDDHKGVGVGVGGGRGDGVPWTLSLSKALFSTCFVDCGGMHDNEDYADNYGDVPTDQDHQGLLLPSEMRREERISLLTPPCHDSVHVSTVTKGSMSGTHFTTTGESLPSPLSMTSHGHHGDHTWSHSFDNEDNDHDSDKDYMDAISFQLDKDDTDNDNNNKEEEKRRTLTRSPRRHNLNSTHNSHRESKRCDEYENNITVTDNVIFSSLLSSTRLPSGLKGSNGSRGNIRDNQPVDVDINAEQWHKQRRQATTASATYAMLPDFGPEHFM